MWQSAYDFIFNDQDPTEPVEPVDYGPGPGPWNDADPGNVWNPTGFQDRGNDWVADPWRYGEESKYQPMILPAGWDPYDIDGFDFSKDQAGYGWYESQDDLGSFSALMHSPYQTGHFDGDRAIGRGFAGFRRPTADGGGPADTNEAYAAYYDQTWDESTRTRTGNTFVKDDWKVDPWDIKPGEGFDPALQAGWDADISNNLFSNMSSDLLGKNYYWDIAPTQGTTPAIPYGAGGHEWRNLGPESHGFGSWLRAGTQAAGDLPWDHPDFVAKDTKSYWDARDGRLSPGQKGVDYHGFVGTSDDWWELHGGNYDNLNTKVKRAGRWDQTDHRNLDFLKDLPDHRDHHLLRSADKLLGMQYGDVAEKKNNKYWERGDPEGYDAWLYPNTNNKTWYSTPNVWEHNVGKDAFSVWNRTVGKGKHDYDTSTKGDWTAPDDWAQIPEQFWNGEHHGWMAPHDPRNTTDDWAYQDPENPDINWDFQPEGDFEPIWQPRSVPGSENVFNYNEETAGYQLDLDSGSYGYKGPEEALNRYKNYSPYRKGSASTLEGRAGLPKKPYESPRITSEMVPWLPTPHNDSDGWFYGE